MKCEIKDRIMEATNIRDIVVQNVDSNADLSVQTSEVVRTSGNLLTEFFRKFKHREGVAEKDP